MAHLSRRPTRSCLFSPRNDQRRRQALLLDIAGNQGSFLEYCSVCLLREKPNETPPAFGEAVMSWWDPLNFGLSVFSDVQSTKIFQFSNLLDLFLRPHVPRSLAIEFDLSGQGHRI